MEITGWDAEFMNMPKSDLFEVILVSVKKCNLCTIIYNNNIFMPMTGCQLLG